MPYSKPTPCHAATLALYTEPYGAVYDDSTGYFVRRALGRHAAWRSGTARTSRRFDHGPCRAVPHDAHGHEEARRRSGAGVAREVPPALGRTLRRVGQGCRGTDTKGEER